MDRRFITAIFLMVACAAGLSLAAHFFAVFPLDLKITGELREENNSLFSSAMHGLSALGETWIALVMIGAVAVFFLVRRQWTEACFVLLTASNFVLTSFLKLVVARPRPPYFILDPADLFALVNQYSFPSGHVLFFVVFFGFIAYLAGISPAGRARGIILAACAALILLIGPSRVYLGAHWASDVLGSYIIGALWLFFIILAYRQVAGVRNTG